MRIVRSMGIVAMIAVFLTACIPPGPEAQKLSEQQATAIVLDAGKILYGDPAKWRTIFDDFDIISTALWDTTSIVQGSVSAPDSSTASGTFYLGKPAIVATKNTTNAITHLRWKGQGFRFLGGKYLEYEARFALSDTTDCAWEVGMIYPQTSVTGHGESAEIGFGLRKRQANSVTWWHKGTAAAGLDSTATTTRLAPMTWYTIRFLYTGSAMKCYINDVLVKNDTGAPPTGSLTPWFEARTGTTAVKKIYIDYIRVRQARK